MTAKQKANRERFKKVVAEAKKLRQKNPKLTQAQAVARAWAISYGKKSAAKKKKVGATKIIQKGESKNAKVTKVLQQTRTKKGQFKGYKRIGRHTDTKSHNVNIRVVSGIDDQMLAIRNNLEKSIDYYMQSISKIQNAYGRLEAADKAIAKKTITKYKTYITKLLRQLRETNAMIAKNAK